MADHLWFRSNQPQQHSTWPAILSSVEMNRWIGRVFNWNILKQMLCKFYANFVNFLILWNSKFYANFVQILWYFIFYANFYANNLYKFYANFMQIFWNILCKFYDILYFMQIFMQMIYTNFMQILYFMQILCKFFEIFCNFMQLF